MKVWADLDLNPPPPKGFHSSDNGAIHIALMNWFRQKNDEKVMECKKLYYELKGDVSNLDPYWKFVYCSRKALGKAIKSSLHLF